jgi:hypothetical protein
VIRVEMNASSVKYEEDEATHRYSALVSNLWFSNGMSLTIPIQFKCFNTCLMTKRSDKKLVLIFTLEKEK